MQSNIKIPLFKVYMAPEITGPLQETLYSGYIGQGPKVALFEKLLSSRFNNPNILALNSGTSAIHLALRLAGVVEGDEVISTPMTCSATNSPILARGGARIVWADINPNTGNIDPNSIEKKITPKTKAIVIVHWGGYPCDVDEINTIAKKHGIKVIGDAAHAFGAKYKGRMVGSNTDFVCFSFQAIKHLTTVDGGALACKSEVDYERGKKLRWFGIDRDAPRTDMRCEQDIEEFGYKFHMNDMNATLGIHQLTKVDYIVSRHRENAAFYRNHLTGLKSLSLLDYKPDRESSYWLFTVRVKDQSGFTSEMMKRGIMVSQVHSRNDKFTVFKSFQNGPLPGLEEFSREQVSIPVGWWVTDEDREYIVKSIQEVCG